jgi:hypothetical protein
MKKIFFIIIGILLICKTVSAGDPGAIEGWSTLGTGLNGEVKAVTYYNGNLIAAGSFTTAGGVPANRIAMWNGTSWMPLGQGVSGEVYALAVYNSNLYVGGDFTNAGGVAYTSYIAKWNGANWSAVGIGLNDEVTSFAVYSGQLIVGGKFNVGLSYNIASWNGTSWLPMGSGTNEDVNALTVWGDSLVAGGRFSTAGGVSAGKIAKWDGTNWSAILNTATFNDEIFSVGVFNNLLYAGGKFTAGSGVLANYLVCFYNNQWVKVGNGVEDRIYSILYYGHSMVVGGQHKFSYNTSDSVYVNRVSVFNGIRWSGFSTGMNDKVNAVIETPDGALIAAGEFTTAGGRVANRIAIWDTLTQASISGTVRFSGSNLPVPGGYVKAVRVDLNTRQVLVVDSASITTGGNYLLAKVRSLDTVDIIVFPPDTSPELDFTPTYYPSTLYWEGATTVFVTGNLTNIHIHVDTANHNSATGTINGQVILNYTPPGFIGSGLGLDFKSSAIVYAKLGGVFKNFGITNNYQMYSVTSLPAGNYEMIANRLGYTSDTIMVNVPAGGTVNNINFNLKPLDNPVGIDPGGIELVKDFKLNQNYPNPFNPETNIEFTLDRSGFVSLKIYNVLGMEVASFYDAKLNEGTHTLKWNAGRHSSGVYYYKLSFNGVEQTKSMMLIK